MDISYFQTSERIPLTRTCRAPGSDAPMAGAAADRNPAHG